MAGAPSVKLIPLAGAFHTRWPRYNSVHVRVAASDFDPDVVALSLPRGAFDTPAWQATDEIALPLSVVPWARQAGVRIELIGIGDDDPDDPGDAGAERDLLRFLDQYDAGRERLALLNEASAPLRELLASPLDARRVIAEALPAVAALQAERARLLEPGPGTGWLTERSALLASRILAAGGPRYAPETLGVRVAALVPLDYYPFVAAALEPHAELVPLGDVEAGEEARARALMDLSFQGGGEDPAALLASLAELSEAEARYHEANLLFELGHASEARAKLESLVAGDFSRPYYLPGFALTRLGQLHDLAGDRSAALRNYRGALALDFLPEAAAEAASAGLAAPFAAGQGRG